ncbi:DinB family protein [Flavobacterium sp.]|uniref:DinB family protein n=1 Tax=Flavobacterium sp. TaxID=239 RepID=UPI003D11494E
MKSELQQEIKTTFEQLYQTLSLFEQNQINVVPFESSWTAGQVTKHIIKATSGFYQICNGKTQKLNGVPDEKVAVLEGIFLDFTTKYNSPDFIYPENKEYEKKELLSRLHKIEKEILDIAVNYDLTQTCLDFEIPGIGNLTIYELVSFAILHTKRHIHQLQNIQQKIKN